MGLEVVSLSLIQLSFLSVFPLLILNLIGCQKVVRLVFESAEAATSKRILAYTRTIEFRLLRRVISCVDGCWIV